MNSISRPDVLDNTQDIYRLVGKLEGALDASEIHDVALVDQWHEYDRGLNI